MHVSPSFLIHITSNQMELEKLQRKLEKQETLWDLHSKMILLADAADKAMDNHEVCTVEWYKAWGYASGMPQACIEILRKEPANETHA